MHRRNKIFISFLSLLLVTSAMTRAQDAPQQEDAVFRSDTRLVVLHASVVDNKGRLVTTLKQEAFKVFENGKEQKLRTFRQEDVPVSLGLIVDNSGSMRNKRQKVEAAAIAMIKASNPQDEVMVVNYNDEAYEDTPLTSDLKRMEEGLSRIDARGGTAMYDAISMTMDRLIQKGKHEKKVIMLITDGNDNASVTKLEQLIRKVTTNHDIVIHCIGILEEEEKREARKAKRAVEAIATATGGLFYFPKDLSEVEKISLEIAHDIRNQYVLGYSPDIQQLDGSFRQIKVTANGPNRPTVRTRSGYYATPSKGKPNS